MRVCVRGDLCLCHAGDIWEELRHRVYPQFCGAQGTMNYPLPRKLILLHACRHTQTHVCAHAGISVRKQRRRQIAIFIRSHRHRGGSSRRICKDKYTTHVCINTQEDRWIHANLQHEERHTNHKPIHPFCTVS